MPDFINQVIETMKKWDWLSIFYKVFASLLTVILLKWGGLFRFLYSLYKQSHGIKVYKKDVKNICTSLIVIGKRQGFSIHDVYIQLDIAQSDLMASSKQKSDTEPKGSYVLVGGPGAGKSTMVKQMVLKNLEIPENTVPFYVRLREYDISKSIEEYLIEKIKGYNIPKPEIFVRNNLIVPWSLCVLDGLDEVRPNIRDLVFQKINQFYKKYFVDNHHGQLIVTCRKEAYRPIPLDLPTIWEVRPLTDEQIKRFAQKWPLGYPTGKSYMTFCRDLFSSSRILELARSPLLLVGGLMQYTESNIGIPEARIEYLARIAHWLVTDWATAQGHPPDTYRTVYPRILAKLAFEMHSSQRSEFTTDEALKLIEIWLPSYGYTKEEARILLENIMTKTGILVRDVPAHVIFAQFGLQEYYASIDAIDNLGVTQFAKLDPKTWWREVILLSIAQEKEPVSYLNELYAEDPLLFSAAVAECPTPSIDLQEKAIEACVRGLDDANQAVRGSMIALARKVKGAQEERLVTELEKRLSAKQETSSAVGLILATADTPATTTILSRHPAVWDTCLETTGFLSSSFENLLVQWIKSGDEQQSKHAADLLSPRLSADRFEELLALLPVLPVNRSEYLAMLLLNHLENGLNRKRRYGGEFYDFLQHVSRCVPFVRNTEGYLNLNQNEPFMYRENLIPTALFLTGKKKKRSDHQILRLLTNSIEWSSKKGTYACYVASSIVLLSFVPKSVPLLAISLILYALAIISPSNRYPWEVFRMPEFQKAIASLSILLVGGAFMKVFMPKSSLTSDMAASFYNFEILAMAYVLTGLTYLRKMHRYTIINFHTRLNNVSLLVWTSALIMILALSFISPAILNEWLFMVTFTISTLLIINYSWLYFQWRIVRSAAHKSASALFELSDKL